MATIRFTGYPERSVFVLRVSEEEAFEELESVEGGAGVADGVVVGVGGGAEADAGGGFEEDHVGDLGR